MNGSDLIQEIDELLAEANAPEVEVLITSDGAWGTTAPNGKFIYKVNKSYPLMFQLSSDEYSFENWVVVNRETGEVLQDAVTFDNPSQLETNFKINYEVTNLWIHPKCVQYPRVINALPQNKAGGVICYSPIELIFNMPISSEGVVETFDNISIKIEGNSILDYFNTPVLSEDGTKITIKPKPAIKDLVENISFCDITVSVSDAIKSADNPDLHIEQYSYTYRINSAKDTTPPSIKSVVISKDVDQKFSIQKNADYNNWQNSDIEYNHVNNSVWISCEAIDSDSGIDSIIITETVVNNADGTPRNQVLPEKTVTKEFQIVNSEEYKLEAFEYTLSTGINSLVKLNVKVKDRAGYYSTNDEFNYYVVAEPVFINDAVLKFDIRVPDNENNGKNAYRFTNQEGFDVQKLLKIKNIKHSFYKDNYSKIDIKINYWNGKNEPSSKNTAFSTSITAKDDEYVLNKEVLRNPDEITTIEMILTDDLGHSYTQLYKIPCSPKIVDVDFLCDPPYLRFSDISDDYYDETLYYVVSYLINEDEENIHIINPVIAKGHTESDVDLYSDLEPILIDGTQDSAEVYAYISAFCYDEGKNNHTYGCINSKVHLHCTYDSEYDYIVYERVYDGITGTGDVVFPSTVNVVKELFPETGLIGFNLSYPQDFIPTPNITYVPYYTSLWYYDDEKFYFSTMSCNIESSAYSMYYLGIVAIDSVSGEIRDTKEYGAVIGNDDGWESLVDDSFVILDATDNIAQPKIEAEKSRKNYEQLKPNACILGVMNTGSKDISDIEHYITFESLSDGRTDLIYGTNLNGHKTVQLDYCYLENPILNYGEILKYSSSLGINFNNRIYVEMPSYKAWNASNNMEKFIATIPCNSAENSYYTMYGKIYDTNGTSTVKELGVASTYVYNSLPEVEKVGTENIKIKVDKSKAEAGSDIKVKLYSVTDGDYWLESINTIEYSTIGFANKNVTSLDSSSLRYKTQNNSTFDIITNLSTTNSFFNNRYVRFYIYTEPTSGENKEFMHKFYKTVYIYPNYYTQSITCNKKNFVEGANGLQFFVDQPTLVQTLYCKGNLGNDPDLWATKGLEADVKVITSDCTYQPKTDEAHLPSGNYYCVVVHFADGSTCMSSVKYK